MTERAPVTIIDVGSAFLRAGLSGTNSPSVTFPALVGRSTPTTPSNASLRAEGIVGSSMNEEQLPYTYHAISHGQISNFDAMERLLQYLFHESLQLDPRAIQVLMSESSIIRYSEKETLAELVFESFGAAGFYSANSAALVLLAYGKLTGVVLECGNQFTSATPIFDGHPIRSAVSIQPVCGGEQLDRYLGSLLVSQGHRNLRWSENKTTLRLLRQKYCLISPSTLPQEKLTTLPVILADGTEIKLTDELQRVPDALFQPGPLGTQARGIIATLENAIFNPSHVDRELQSILCGNIALAGGSTLFPNLVERMEWEIMSNLPRLMNPSLLPDTGIRRDELVWTGGSILGSMPHFPDICISKADYEEFGPRIVHLKCV